MSEVLKQRIDGTLKAGAENFGQWQQYTGGRIVSEAGETRDPGGNLPRPVPGPKTIENITLSRDYDDTRDSAMLDRLEALCGTDTVFTVGQIRRDSRGNPTSVKTRVGILLEVGPPEGDTDGGTDKAKLEAVFKISG